MKNSQSLSERIKQSADWLNKKFSVAPQVGLILGTGLGGAADAVKDPIRISYGQIPNFPISTAPGHSGCLVYGTLHDKTVLIMEGRFHFYEGYSLEDVTFPIRVMKALGIGSLILTSAAGSMNPEHQKGDIVAVSDHINFMGVNPLVGPNESKLGVRFPDMIEPYSARLIDLAEKIAQKEKIRIHRGVYVGVVGPCLETRAEYRMLRILGADIVGMSQVPEAIVAVHAGLETLGLSVVTDTCLPDKLEPVQIEEVIQVATDAGPVFDKIIAGVLANS